MGMIEARSLELDEAGFADFAALQAYLDLTAGAVFHLGAERLGASGDLSALSAEAATAYGLTGLMRALPYHAAHGTLFLPQSLLAAHGLHPNAILAGSDNADLRAALRDVAARASGALARFRGEALRLPRAARPAFLPVALTGPYLQRMADPARQIFGEIVELNPLRRYWLIWRGFLTGRF